MFLRCLQPHLKPAWLPEPLHSQLSSHHSLSIYGSAHVSPGAKLTAAFHPGTKTSSRIFPGLYDSCCCLGFAHLHGIWQLGASAVFDRTCLLVTFGCQHLTACGAARAKRAHRCCLRQLLTLLKALVLGNHLWLPVKH